MNEGFLFKKNRMIFFIRASLLAILLISVGCSQGPKDIVAEQYQYDHEGKLICKIAPDGSKIRYRYNTQGLPIEIEYPEDHVKYGYDENGNCTWMKNNNGETSYKYDALNRLTEVVLRYSQEKRLIYEYDPWSRISEIKILDGQNVNYRVQYKYNILGNLISIDDGVGQVKYSYYPEKGEVIRQLPNGITTVASFSLLGELTSLEHLDPQGRQIVSYHYEYDPSGKASRVIEKTSENVRITQYTWNRLGYLEALHLPNGKVIRYQYDAMGNRVLEKGRDGIIQYKYDNLGKLVRAGRVRYIWDKNGNLTAQIRKNGKTRFEYDPRNLPVLVETPDATIRYRYDGNGNMIARQSGQEITHYLPSSLAPPGYDLAEFDRNGRITASYLYGDTLLGRRNANGQMHYYLEDGFHSIRHIIDVKGNIIGQQDYSPYADPIFKIEERERIRRQQEKALKEAERARWKEQERAEKAEKARILIKEHLALSFRMAGERFLPEIESYMIGRRLYQPRTGRYLTPDPLVGSLERFDSFNRYAHGCRLPGIFMEPRCNQTKKGQRLTGWINGRSGTYVEDSLKTGWGSGSMSDVELLRQAEGRFGIVDVAGDPAGLRGDIPNTLLNDPLQARSPQWNAPYFSKNSWHHSRGNIVGGPYQNRYQLDPSRLGALPLDNTVQGIVSDLSSIEPYLGQSTIGVQFRAKSDNLLVAGAEALGNVFRLVRGVGKAVGGTITSPRTGEGPFASHSLESLFERVPQEWNLPTPYSYRDVQIVRRNSDGSIQQASLWHWNEQSKEWQLKGISQNVQPGKFGRRQLGEKRRGDDEKGPSKPPDCPWCGNGGNGGGGPESPGGPLDDGFTDPFQSVEAKLGGIKLDATAQFMGGLGDITGAVYDPERQVLVLVGDRSASLSSIRAEDFAVALTLPQDPQFSLDPADPRNPKGKWLKAVYIPEEIIGRTELGKALFEADWLLKQYSFGVRIDPNGKLRERKSSVPGFRSTADLSFEEQGRQKGKERWARFWIVADDMDNDKEHNMLLKLANDEKTIYFDVAKIRVKTKKQVPDPKSHTGLRDVDTEDDPIATKFAKGFTELYDRIAKESPEFDRVKQLAKIVAIAKWIKQKGIPFDESWANEYAHKRIDTVGRITALSTRWEKKDQKSYQQGNLTKIETAIHELYLFGGVDLTVKPKYTPDDGRAHEIQKRVRMALQKGETGPVFDITHEGKPMRGVILPITKSGQERWKKSPTFSVRGTNYQYDNQQKMITRRIDDNGNITEYRYDPDKKLNEIKVSGQEGWTATGQRGDHGSEWTFTDSKGNNIRYRYGSSGHLEEMELPEGKPVTFEYGQDRVIAHARHKGYAEKLSVDPDGYIQEYEMQRSTSSPQEIPEVERLHFTYDNKKNVTKIRGSGLAQFDISYTDNNLPLSIKTAQGEIHFSHDAKGHLNNISFSDGPSITYSYEGEELRKVEVVRENKRAEYTLGRDGILHSRDLLGGTADYYYTQGVLRSVALNGSERARYAYDERNRLREIRFPDGQRIEYRYQERKGQSGKASSSPVQFTTKISHAAPPEKKPPDTMLARQTEDIKEASKDIKNGIIMGVFVGSENAVQFNIINSKGDMRTLGSRTAKELRNLFRETANATATILRKESLERWDNFSDTYLAPLAKPEYREFSDKKVKIKPLLIIKSNEVTEKYASIVDKAPVLGENSIVYIASNETSATELVRKINNIPKITKDNIVFAVRLPEEQLREHPSGPEWMQEWKRKIEKLERIVGKENILFDPSREDFSRMLNHLCQLNPLGARASRPQRAAKMAALPGSNLKLTQMDA